MSHFKKTGGFTLAELIIAIAILVTLSSVAVAGYASYLTAASNTAAESFLNQLKKHILIANVEAGGVDAIEVYPMGEETLGVKVKAVCFADGFVDHIEAAYPDAFDIAPNDADNMTIYTFYISVPLNWTQSDYADAGKLVYNWQTEVWEEHPS